MLNTQQVIAVSASINKIATAQGVVDRLLNHPGLIDPAEGLKRIRAELNVALDQLALVRHVR